MLLSKKKTNSLTKINDEDSMEHNQSNTVDATSIDNNNDPEEDIKIVFIPKVLHEQFECVVGKHVFIDKPWTKISRIKIINHLQDSKSCFWQFRRQLEEIKNEFVLVGYKPFSNTDEEFLICITDKAKQYVEETQAQIEREIKQKVEQSTCRASGSWESKNSDKDIEEIKPVQTREKITYKWTLPAGRLQAKVEFKDSNSKSMKNEHVKLESRPKEIFESDDVLRMDSGAQAVRIMVNREMQTKPRIKNNKCIQSVAVEEEMFQLQPLTKSDKAIDDFLEKHVPNLVNELHYNELYDLYRDDYKLLKNDTEKQINQNSHVIKFLPKYHNIVSKKKYVSSQTWHPTLPGIFAVSYTLNSNALYKSVSLQMSHEEMTKSTVEHEKYGISCSDDEYNHVSWNDQPKTKLVDENYKEKIMSLLNKEFIQRMRIIEVSEDEKMNEQYNQDIIKQLRNNFNYATHQKSSTNKEFSKVNLNSHLNLEPTVSNKKTNYTIENKQMYNELDDGKLINENINEIRNEFVIDTLKNIKEWNELSIKEKEFEIQNNEMKGAAKLKKSITTLEVKDEDRVDHHDSDTESFYNIWGNDEEWLFGNNLRDVVRNLHRKFNQKYDREAREEKLFRLLESEAKYAKRKNKIDNMEKERMKLIKDMCEAGDTYNRLRSQVETKKRRESSKKHNKHHKAYQNEKELIVKQENMPIRDEQNNSVIIWSISDNIFPKLKLESPEEVCCVEFNPRNGNTVIGGLTNGQICIWDINGKLDMIDSNNLNVSEKEKMHHNHLWMQMKWSLDINFQSIISPAALSAILESHESAVTAIQWIHPMNEITPLGKLVTMQEEQFSNQFFSASMDGTIKLWDLNSALLPKLYEKNTTTRFERPKNLKKYESPLNIYHNRLKPTYTILITGPETAVRSPITAMSFEIPVMQYNYITNQPFVIGKSQFEYVPETPNNPNRILVVGNVMGQIGTVTWHGYNTHEESKNKEVCKHIWWGHVHDGPINCIKRNIFYPDIHLVCGGHIVSIWSLNYKGGPVWWKRFNDCTNSVLWSNVHPAQFQVSFTTGGVLEFWNIMKCIHQPYYTSNIFLGDGLIAMLSASRPSIHYIGAESFKCAKGINEVMDQDKYELISFSDSAGTIMLITIDTMALKPNEIEEVRLMFQKEVDRRKELDAWNDTYREQFKPTIENDVEDYDSTEEQIPAENDNKKLTAEQIKKKTRNENFKSQTRRLGKIQGEYAEREKRYMIETMMKKKNVDQKQLEEYLKESNGKKYDEDRITKRRFNPDETHSIDVKNILLAEEHSGEYMFDDIDSKKRIDSDDVKKTFQKIHQLLVTDFVVEKEKFRDYIKNNSSYESEQEDWAQVIENAEREIRDRLNDQTLFKNPDLRKMRRKLAKKYIDEDYKFKEWTSRKNVHVWDRYEIRERNIYKLKNAFGKNYDPHWDNGLQPQKKNDTVQTQVTTNTLRSEDYKQSYDGYFKENGGEGDRSYEDHLSLTETNSESSYVDRSGTEPEFIIDKEKAIELDTELFRNTQICRDYNEYYNLETLDEQD